MPSMFVHKKRKFDRNSQNVHRKSSRRYSEGFRRLSKKRISENNLTNTNRRNAELLAKMYGIEHIEKEGDIIGQMCGMFKDYSGPGIDSVELVHAVRGEF